MFTAALLAVALADGVTTNFIASGAVAKAGGYRPIRAALSPTAPTGAKVPAGLKNAKYGAFEFEDKKVGLIVDGEKVYIDANRDNDFTNDPEAKWESRNNGANWMGNAKVDIGKGEPVGVGFYQFNQEKAQAQQKDAVFYYADFGYEVTLTLDGKENKSFVAGGFDETTSLWVDRNGDGRTSYFKEMVQVGKPFNFTGTTYVLKAANNGLALEKSSEKVEMTPMPPDLAKGKQTLTFKAKTMNGRDVNFPTSYKGKIVLLDFWATWCGPCLAEMPHVTAAYEKYNKKGFEILGISFDDKDAVQKINETAIKYKMSWDHVYEGKGWNTTLGEQFDVSAIPFTLLVDGSTGEIIGVGNELRGDGLEKILATKLGG